jgi:hypothetical protein
VYCAVWYAVSFNMRSRVQDIERSAEFAQAVPAGASEFRTLIIDNSYGKNISRNPVANGAIDRLVKVLRDSRNQINQIKDSAASVLPAIADSEEMLWRVPFVPKPQIVTGFSCGQGNGIALALRGGARHERSYGALQRALIRCGDLLRRGRSIHADLLAGGRRRSRLSSPVQRDR